MKKSAQLVITILALGLTAFQAKAFTSLYIFGDGVSTTTNNTSGLNYYYGKRYSNGRVWVEVLAQRLGLGANSLTNANWSNSSNNWSYYGQYSSNLLANLNHFARPADAGSALFVVWVNDADFVNDMVNLAESLDSNPADWNKAMSESLTNHWCIITNLYYGKGARTLVMPNAIDITEIPQYDGIIVQDPSFRDFIRQQVINFNAQFALLLQQEQDTLPGLTIYEPDFFSLLDSVLTNSAAYGLTNVLFDGVPTYAVGVVSNPTMNGQGTNYIYWDPVDPTAKVHEIMADTVLQMIAPVQISDVAVLGSIAVWTTNRLDLANVPVGLSGYVDGRTNAMQTDWTTVTNFNSVSLAQSVFVSAPPLPPIVLPSGNGSIYPGAPGNPSSNTNSLPPPSNAMQSYRLRFPFGWTWP